MNKRQQTTTQRRRPFGRLLCVAIIVLIVVSGILPVAKAAASITDLASLTQIGNHTVDTVSYPVYQYTVTSTEDQFTFNVSDSKCKLLSKKPVIGEKWSSFTPAYGNLLRSKTDEISVASDLYSSLSFSTEITSKLKDDTSKTAFFIATRTAGFATKANVASINGILIVEWETAGSALTDKQKEPLSTLLTTVADGNNNYIQSGDRYNGKEYNPSGFWATFTEKNGPRAKAQNVLDTATEESQITAAVADLRTAISNLIPTSQLNATYLYETLQQYNYSDEYLDDFTAPSVRKFRAVRSAAQSYLDSLFDKATGAANPTENVSANQDKATNYAKELRNCRLVSKDAVEESKVNLRSIQALDKKYAALKENSGKYTDASWKKLTDARDAAVNYAAAHPISENTGVDEPKQYASLTRAFLKACYELETTGDTVNVTFVYTDDLHLRTPQSGIIDPAQNKAQIKAYSLPTGSTFDDLLKETGYVKQYEVIDVNGYSIWHTFVNGTLLYGMTPGVEQYLSETDYVLKDGDIVQFVHMEWPSYVYNYIYRDAVDWTNMSSSLGALRFKETGTQKVGAGEEATLTVERTSAHLWSWTGSYSPYEGATIAAYGPQNKDGSYPDTPILLTGTSYDASGSVSFKLYEEGKYLVTAYDARANDEDQSIFYSGNIAAPYLELTVGEATQPDAVRAELKAALDEVYNAYPKKIFSEDAWTQIEDAYNEAVAVLNNSSASTGKAYLAQQTAIRFIQSKQTETVQANKTALETFRRYLNNLPDNTDKITASATVKEAAQKLLQCYKDMNSYQRSQLTGAEKAKYGKIKAYMDANGEKLPAAQKYKLTLNVVGDTDDATAALNDMIQYLHDHPATQDTGAGGSGDVHIQTDTPFMFATVNNRKNVEITDGMAEPLTSVRLLADLEYAAYFHVRDAIFKEGKAAFTVDGKNWSISDENIVLEKNGTYLYYDVTGDLTVKIDGVKYEIKSITYDGISKNDVANGSLILYDNSGYKGKNDQWINLEFDEGYYGFAMPYNDVTVTITWGPAESDSSKLLRAKETASNIVRAKYNGLDKTQYNETGKAALDEAMTTGLDEIAKATTEVDVITARKKAVSAMEKVPTIGHSSESGKVGEHYPYPDSEVVGRVHVIVENTTYLDESLPDNLKNTIVDGYYDLTADDSMMTVALKALDGKEYTWNRGGYDYGTTYLASVEKGGYTLAEFTGGPNSGWMGTLNDWFVNASFSDFRCTNGKLEDGDEIRLMYTTKLGVDIGGTWSSVDTSLSALTVSGGLELSPAFSSTTTDYVLTIPEEETGVSVRFTAANKNYQARMYLNSYNNENSRYMSGDMLSVSSGDVIYVGVGERAWGSMNNGGTATKYTIQVVKSGSADDIVKLIDDLPAANRLTLDDARNVRMAINLFKALSDADQTLFRKNHKAEYDKLVACEKVIDDMTAADAVTTIANKLPAPGSLMLRDKEAVYAAKAALDKLTADQKQYLTSDTISSINQCYARMLQMERNYVQQLIDNLPSESSVTLADKKQIYAAKAAYDALTDKTGVDTDKLDKALAALKKLEQGGSGEDTGYSEYLKKALSNIKKTVPTPQVGSVSGEWAVLGLARGNASVTNSYYDGYYDRVVAYVKENINSNEQLDSNKSTENSRIILALTAIGEDPTSVGGHNLLTALNDLTFVKKQGSNGPIWALLAVDSGNYEYTKRSQLIEAILADRTEDGGWTYGEGGADADMTAMAIQALAPYNDDEHPAVKSAISTALNLLSGMQNDDGGFSSMGYRNCESSAQVVVALSALRLDANTDSRFVKNGYSVLDNLLSYEQEDGSFWHLLDGSQGVNQMSAEQGTYALVAYDRHVKGKHSLYDMTDVVKREDASAQEVIDMINRIGTVDEFSYDYIADARNAYDKLSAEDRAKVTNYKTLTDAEKAYSEILKQKQADQYKLLKEHYDQLLNDSTKKYGTAAKKKLLSILQTAQKDMNAAVSCERVIAIYDKAIADLDAVKPGDISVTFRLVGALEATQDVDLTNDSYLPEYVTWIPTTTYALQENATVYDLYTEAMTEAGLRSVGADNNYVKTIYAPSCLGGYALSEFTNGKRSGWMYTVNGSHPNQGLKYWELKDGDVVVWHYVNDYAHEVADWFNDPNYPALGDGTYYNGWLRAADISPEQYVQQLLAKILTVGKHGTVEPKLTFQHIGKSVTFTFKPDSGYKVKDVKVNGKSVGAVKTYTIDKLTVSTRIEVEFTDGKLPFTDVLQADWFYNDVLFVYDAGLFAGTSDTTFSPNAAMTRAMLVTVLYRLEGQPAVNGRSGFSDVTFNSYYEDAVTWAADNGIVNGTSATTFSPNANVTREQMAAILYRYAQYKQYNTAASSSLTGFSDHAAVSSYAVTPMQWAVAEKLINGSAGKLMPTGNATRAQVAAILHRFVENVATTK